jgi:hypothetical protein
MSLTVKHLNSDASFLLTFQPILPSPPWPGQSPKTFTILLDPWISGPSKIFHPKFSISRHKAPPCISSLRELPEPDLVVISQEKSDHCHEQTLTQLPRSGGTTRILAEPAAAKLIKSWKYFDAEKLHVLPRWEPKTSTVHRVAIPPLTPHGSPGEVTIAFLAQKHDITGLHSAIGITYRPPSVCHPLDTPPSSPQSFQTTFSKSGSGRTMSVIYSPHGCSYKTLAPFVTSHLVSEAALPLTALLHCFDKVTNSWYLGGNICSGFPGGLEIAQNLCAKTWISAHDGDKETTGFASSKVVTHKYEREEVESVVSPRSEKFPYRRTGTEAVVLNVGEELTLTQAMDLCPEYEDEYSGKFMSMEAVC